MAELHGRAPLMGGHVAGRLAACTLALIFVGTSYAEPPPPAAGPPGKSEAPPPETGPVDPKLLYALGVLMSTGIDSFNLSEEEFAKVSAGLIDGYHHHADVPKAMSLDREMQVLRRSRVAAMTVHEKAIGAAYIANLAGIRGAKKTDSGLLFIPITEGRGATPSFKDAVKMNYEGKLVDGSVFDSSATRGQPGTFQLNNVMRCFTEGVQLLRVGGKGRIVCPSDLAYGDRGQAPTIRPGATVEYDVELLEILKNPVANKDSRDD